MKKMFKNDQDGLYPAILRGRFQDEVFGAKENLAGTLEYRCCQKIAAARQKFTFDRSIEDIIKVYHKVPIPPCTYI